MTTVNYFVLKGYAVVSRDMYEISRCYLLLVPSHICVTLLLVLQPYLENFQPWQQLEDLKDIINCVELEDLEDIVDMVNII